MLTTIFLILLLGISLGLLIAATITFYLIKVKCPKCKQLKPLKEIIFFHWKERIITGQPCLKCQQTKLQIDIY